jgi:hypothetical protein
MMSEHAGLGVQRMEAPSAADTWGRRLGAIWARLLRQQVLRPGGIVVEIGPGFSAKVGFGLAELGFQGTVILVEPNEPARFWAAGEYRRLLPGAEVRTCPSAIPETGGLASEPVDLVLGNHIIDDLLLAANIPLDDCEMIFGAMCPGSDCSERFIRVWGDMLRSPASTSRTVNRVVGDLVRYVDAIKPRCLLVNQYPSWRHSRSGLDLIHQTSMQAMRRLERRLHPDRPNTMMVHNADESGAAMVWLISPGANS